MALITRRGVARAALVLFATVVAGVCGEFAIRAFVPKFDPSGQLVFYTTPEGFDLGPRSATVRHWTRTGEFDVETHGHVG